MSDELFKQKAPGIMALLMPDFTMTIDDAAAVLGNAGVESGGFKFFQEQHPIAGRGGWGWFQWTGPRRRQFEAYCSRNKLDPKSDKANYGFLFNELRGPYKDAVIKTKMASGLAAKTDAFEKAFEKAGIPNFAARRRYAQIAVDAYKLNPVKTRPPELIATNLPPVPTVVQPKTATASGVIAGATAAWYSGIPWIWIALGCVAGAGIWFYLNMKDKSDEQLVAQRTDNG